MEPIDKVKQLLQPILDNYNAELIDISLKGPKHRPTLRILVDKEGGITLDECADINRELGSLLDKDSPMEGSYILEVSSPGLDNPLRKRKDHGKTDDFEGAI